MLDALLSFFSNLMIIFGGIVTLVIIIGIFVAVGIEFYDMVKGMAEEDEDDF